MRTTPHPLKKFAIILASAAALAGALTIGNATPANAGDIDVRAETITIVETRTDDGWDCTLNNWPVSCELVGPWCQSELPGLECPWTQLIDRDRVVTTYEVYWRGEPVALVDIGDLCDAYWAPACDIIFYFGCGGGILPDCPRHPWQDGGPAPDGEAKELIG